ncbi:MAG: M18 family aminopeptidase [Actinobacteria bacterium]|nr:M18 family aminopeptidase [Actinomycetota bacterium]
MTDDVDGSDLLSFLDASPSQWHAASSSAARLRAAGYVELELGHSWQHVPANGFVVRGAALVGWSIGAAATPTSPLRIVGAHTDSPGLRIKPRPDVGGYGWKQLAVEIYGGALLNSWLDRDLGVAGQVMTSDGARLLHVREAVARVPQLAIHLDRDVNERGLVLDKHTHLTPVWGIGSVVAGEFRAWVAEQLAISPSDVLGWDLGLFDVATAANLGTDHDLLAAGRLDNQVSCWAATVALCSLALAGRAAVDATAVIALFDHEEVGSESAAGAAGPLLEQVLERLALAGGGNREQFLTQLAMSTCVSADNAHSVHPNYPDRHEAAHRPLVNHGPAIKLNHNQRYATSAASATMLQRVFEAAGVPWQLFVSRNNVPCGTTIGPLTATRLGIETVDVGVPQLSMHSARELCGSKDPLWLASGLKTFFTGGH